MKVLFVSSKMVKLVF